MADVQRLKERITNFRLPTFREALRWLVGLPLRLLKFIVKLPLNLVKFIIFLPRNIWRAWTAGAKGIVRIEEWLATTWQNLKEARRWQRLHMPTGRVGRFVYRELNPLRLVHGILVLRTRLQPGKWDAAPGLASIPQAVRWARQLRRHRARFKDIEALRSILYADEKVLDDDPLKPTTGYLGRRSSLTQRQGALLHGLVRFGEIQRVVALNTGYGMANLYIARGLLDNYPMRTCILIALEQDSARAHLANQSLRQLGYTDFAEVQQGTIGDRLPEALEETTPVHMVFVASATDENDLLRHISQIKRQARPGTKIVIAGIRQSPARYRTWKTLSNMPKIAATVDLWRWGILITGSGPPTRLHTRL